MKLEENVSEKLLRGGKQRRRKSLFVENLKIKHELLSRELMHSGAINTPLSDNRNFEP